MSNILLPILILVLISLLSGFALSDQLPYQVPENQRYTINKYIDANGSVDDSNTLRFTIDAIGEIPTGPLKSSDVVSDTLHQDSIRTNGGRLTENKNFNFDSQTKPTGLFNIYGQNVLTYESIKGSHMVGEEENTLSVAGNFSTGYNYIACVFSTDKTPILPAFCNIVSAKSTQLNVNSALISTKNQIRGVGYTSYYPAELGYEIAVSPDKYAGKSFADGIIQTQFAGSIMESRDANDTIIGTEYQWNRTAATNTWKDGTEVSGRIKNLHKTFSYRSGYRV